MNKNLHTIKYIVADYISAAIAWGIFFYLRKSSEVWGIADTIDIVLSDKNFYRELALSHSSGYSFIQFQAHIIRCIAKLGCVNWRKQP